MNRPQFSKRDAGAANFAAHMRQNWINPVPRYAPNRDDGARLQWEKRRTVRWIGETHGCAELADAVRLDLDLVMWHLAGVPKRYRLWAEEAIRSVDRYSHLGHPGRSCAEAHPRTLSASRSSAG